MFSTWILEPLGGKFGSSLPLIPREDLGSLRIAGLWFLSLQQDSEGLCPLWEHRARYPNGTEVSRNAKKGFLSADLPLKQE